MKLIDTYTNLCFFALVLYQRDHIPLYMFLITTIALALYILLKFILTCLFIAFIFAMGKDTDVWRRKRLVHLLIWLDLETFAKLYDPEE